MSKKCANVASHVFTAPLASNNNNVDNDQQGIKSFKLLQQHCVAIFAFFFNWQETGGSNSFCRRAGCASRAAQRGIIDSFVEHKSNFRTSS